MKKTSSSIRDGVNQLRTNNINDVKKAYNFFSKDPLKIVSAATSIYRQNTSAKNYKASDNETKTFQEAQKNLATIIGIQPKEDGSYDDEKLSPLEVLKHAGFAYLKKEKNNDNAFADFPKKIQEVYDSEEKEDIPEEVNTACNSLKMQTFLTEQDFMRLSEEEQQKYLQSIEDYGAEKDYLLRLLKESKETKHEAVDIRNKKYDPDSPSFGKDTDVSSESGDIVDFMMKKIIMAGLDWTLNRSINAAFIIPTAVLYHGGHLIKDSLKNLGSDDAGSGSKSNNKTSVNTDRPMSTEQLIEYINNHRNPYKLIAEKGYSYDFAEITEGLITHNPDIKIEDTEIEFENGSKETITKEQLEEYQKSFDVLISANITTAIITDLEEDPDKTFDRDKLANDIITWNQKDYKDEDAPVSDYLDGLGINKDTLKTAKKAVEQELINTKLYDVFSSKTVANAEVFAANYAQYMLLESQKNSDKSDLTLNDINVFMAQGRNIIYTVYQQMKLENAQDLPSIETLLELSEQMVHESSSSSQTTPNLIEETLKDNFKPQNNQALSDFSQELTVSNVINIEKNNLAALEKEFQDLNNQQAINEEQREIIEERKKRYEIQEKRINKLEESSQGLEDIKIDTKPFFTR